MVRALAGATASRRIFFVCGNQTCSLWRYLLLSCSHNLQNYDFLLICSVYCRKFYWLGAFYFLIEYSVVIKLGILWSDERVFQPVPQFLISLDLDIAVGCFLVSKFFVLLFQYSNTDVRRISGHIVSVLSLSQRIPISRSSWLSSSLQNLICLFLICSCLSWSFVGYSLGSSYRGSRWSFFWFLS